MAFIHPMAIVHEMATLSMAFMADLVLLSMTYCRHGAISELLRDSGKTARSYVCVYTSLVSKNSDEVMLLSNSSKRGISGTVEARWTAGQQVDRSILHQGHNS